MAANTRFSRGKTSFLLPLEKNFFRHRQRHAKKFPVIAESGRKKFLHESESDRKKYFVISEIVKIFFSFNAEVIQNHFFVIPDCSQKRKSSRRQEEFQAPS